MNEEPKDQQLEQPELVEKSKTDQYGYPVVDHITENIIKDLKDADSGIRGEIAGNNLGSLRCTICFDAVTGTHAKLMIKLRHHELTKREFFNAVVNAFLNDEDHFKQFIKEYQSRNGYAKRKQFVLEEEIKDGKETMERFGLLDDDERDDLYNIFDLPDEEAGL